MSLRDVKVISQLLQNSWATVISIQTVSLTVMWFYTKRTKHTSNQWLMKILTPFIKVTSVTALSRKSLRAQTVMKRLTYPDWSSNTECERSLAWSMKTNCLPLTSTDEITEATQHYIWQPRWVIVMKTTCCWLTWCSVMVPRLSSKTLKGGIYSMKQCQARTSDSCRLCLIISVRSKSATG